MEITAAAVDQLWKHMEAEDIPKPIRILVKITDGDDEDCTALSTQFSLHARAKTPGEAIVVLLYNLLNYLASCQQDNIHPISYASHVYLEAFDFGREIKAPELENFVDGLVELRGTNEVLEMFEIRQAKPEEQSLLEV